MDGAGDGCPAPPRTHAAHRESGCSPGGCTAKFLRDCFSTLPWTVARSEGFEALTPRFEVRRPKTLGGIFKVPTVVRSARFMGLTGLVCPCASRLRSATVAATCLLHAY